MTDARYVGGGATLLAQCARTGVCLHLAIAFVFNGEASTFQARLDVAAERRALQEDLTSQRAAAIVRERRLADEREEQLFGELDRRDRQLRTTVNTLNVARAEREQARRELEQVITERDRLASEIARRDRATEAEISEYRRQIAGLTESDNPALTAALQRYADGDRLQQFPIIEQIRRAENKADDAATAARNAARIRQVATLALDMKDRGEKTTASVVALWEEAQAGDPSDHQGWVELGRLYQQAGRLADAARAAERGLGAATSDRQRSGSLSELATVLVQLGDLAGARARYEESLKGYERLVASDPSSTWAQWNVSVALEKVADVLVQSGDLAGARARYEESLTRYERLAAADPSNAQAQRELSASMGRVGEVLQQLGDLAGARARYEESLKTLERLAAADPSRALAQRDVGVTLNKLGEVLARSGDVAGARAHYEEGLKTFKRLAAADPGNARALRDVSENLNNLGDVLAQSGDFGGAQARYEEGLKLAEPLAAADPSNAQAQRDVAVSISRLASLPGGQSRWVEVVRILETLDRRGVLAPPDRRLLELARANAATQP